MDGRPEVKVDFNQCSSCCISESESRTDAADVPGRLSDADQFTGGRASLKPEYVFDYHSEIIKTTRRHQLNPPISGRHALLVC